MKDLHPTSTECVVIGGGIIGVSTALFLARKGIATILCEKGRIAGEQSSRNWGWTRLLGRDFAEIPLGIESLRLWADMDRLTGQDTGWRRCGIVNLCQTEAEMARQQAWIEKAHTYQIEARVLSGAALTEALPGYAGHAAGGVHTPGDGRAEPAQATAAIARAAAASGATLLTECAVRGIDRTAGRISGVITEHGLIRCTQVVLAGGAWSRLFAGNAGLDLPSLQILGSVMRTAPLDGLPEASVGDERYAFRKRLDGGYTIARRNGSISDITPDSFRQFRTFLPSLASGWRELRLRLGPAFLDEWRMPRSWGMDEITPFESCRVLDPKPSQRTLNEAKAALVQSFPGFAQMQIKQSWGGMMDVTPDAVPVISDIAAIQGLYIAAGFSGHGFGLGPGAGRLMADLVAGDTPVADPAPFRFARLNSAR